jgi:Zn-dependent protease with chaperone function
MGENKAMDFFTQQEKARKKTGLLVFFFVTAVLLIITALYAAIAAILLANKPSANPFQPELLAGVIGITLAIVAAGSIFKMQQLKKGGCAVAEMLCARPVASDTKDFKEKQLLNVVEEMSIASGTVMPSVYILEEQGINAFAAGWKTSDAAVCVTRGCLEFLSRDELQGVIAHEFSHIFNGDMRLNIRLMGFIFGILFIGQIGYWVLRGTGRSRGVRVHSNKGKGGGAGAIVLIALAFFVIGYIGVFFGNLIKAAVSRSREFLADASAVQFTRNPPGIAGALKKIGGLAGGSRIIHHNASQASHLFFANGLAGFWSSVFATHPPLDKRIKAIDPAFNGEFPVVKNAVPDDKRHCAPAASPAPAPKPAVRIESALLLASVGAPTQEHVAYSSRLMASIPNQLRLGVLDRIGAQAAIAALLLSREVSVRALQIACLELADARLAPRVTVIEPLVLGLDRSLYATVCSLAINSLRSMEQKDYQGFSAVLKTLVEADRKIDLFEYMLMRMVKRYIEPRFSKSARPGASIRSIEPVAAEISMLMSVLSWESADSPVQAENAFKAGAAVLGGSALKLLSCERCSLGSLDQSLEKLDRLVPMAKRQVLNASVAVASIDGLININEAEYLRTIADALDCPIPPVIVS